MEIKEYYAIAVKWWWLLVLCMVLGGGSAYVVSSLLPPVYEASTLLLIGGSLDTVNPTTGELATSEKLAQTYAELLTTRRVLTATRDALDLPDAFLSEPGVTVSVVRNTQALRITVSNHSAQLAADIANELASQLILQSPSAPEREEQRYREFTSQQLAELEGEITALSAAIAERAGTPSAERDRLQEELNTRRTSYSMLLSYQQDSSVNYITVFESAVPPEDPVGPKLLQNTVLAAIVGLMLAGGTALLIEYLDDTVRRPEDVEEVLGLSMLGSVVRREHEGKRDEVVVLTHPVSSYAEGYRILRSNLRYALPADRAERIFLFTSVGPGEGKTTVSANLAAAWAMTEQRTVLIDADMRRPRQHEVWELEDRPGLSSFLVGDVDDLSSLLQPTEIDGLQFISSGPIPPNAAELLDSERMKELFRRLRDQADVFIVDSPPLFAVADATILAEVATASVLVVDAGKTKLEACASAAEALKRAGDNITGVVLNNLEPKHAAGGSYYGGYGGYGHVHEASGTKGPKMIWRRLRKRLGHVSRRAE